MGIRIDGASDLINATDGSLTIEGQSINSTGIGTFSGGVKVGSAATIHSTGQFNIGVAATIFASGNATFAGIVTTAQLASSGAIQSFYNTSLPVTDSRPILQLGYGVIGDNSSGYNDVTCNAYPVNGDSSYHYIGGSSLGATRYQLTFGDHIWSTASAGTRGNDITWTERARIDSSGRLLLGTTTEGEASADNLTIADSGSAGLTLRSGTSNTGHIFFSDATSGSAEYDGYMLFNHSSQYMALGTATAERLRIDSSGRLLIGSTASKTIAVTAASPQLQLEGVGSNASSAAIICNQDAVAGPVISLGKTRGGSVGGTTVVQSGDHLGQITFEGSDGSAQRTAARIASYVDGTPGSSDMPGRLMFYTTPDGSASEVERLRIKSSGQILYSAASGDNQITSKRTNAAGSNGNYFFHLAASDNNDNTVGSLGFHRDTAVDDSRFVLFTRTASGSNTERLRITSEGTFLAGTTNTNDLTNGGMKIQTEATDGQANALNLRNPQLTGANAAVGIVFNMDRTGGGIHFNAGGISAKKRQEWTSTPSTVDSYISIKTITDETTAERCRIGYNKASAYFYHVDDEITIASSSTADIGATLCCGTDQNYHIFASNSQTCMFIGRQTDDGNLIDFRQAGTSEGTISVSGSTVSYNGGHLSRWSQLPGLSNTDTSARPTIYRGTVMSNLDEMCEWTGEENLQLNKTQVSTVASDPNVGGIFWEWDDNEPLQGESHDYKNDFYIAMTGDTIIRVGAGVSVTKGDLLESAGDGTARPQSDDIIRSKTIAKVMSNVGIVTYADNSYCVPCLLMAC
tara:strand:- start:372 stop:2774 length:2403 start_codon:yes stop_codon:yes gene_type:complete